MRSSHIDRLKKFTAISVVHQEIHTEGEDQRAKTRYD
jgi:hypothetical protein